jgi:RNA polymerase-binding transcription factor DksA
MDEIIDSQGWSEHTVNKLLTRFIYEEKKLGEELEEFLQKIADEENFDVCEECGAVIPVVEGGGLVNKHHKDSCSLYDPDQD